MADALFDRALELVMDAGQTLLENGGEVFRAQQTMEIMAASLGVRDFHVYVLTNGIFASAHLPGRERKTVADMGTSQRWVLSAAQKKRQGDAPLR